MTAPASLDSHRATRPYPGLRPFQDDEAEIFFGREKQTDQLLEKLLRSRLIAVVGPSGCGKSSLVRAGLIAALESGFLTDAGAGWRIAQMRPGDLPMARLAEALLAPAALGPECGSDASELAIVQAMLRRGPLGLVEVLRETRLPGKENLLLLVDQFEEIFRFREQGRADDADAFVALLLASAAQRDVPVYVVITMRSDFLGDCALFAGLPEAINDSQYLTPRLSRDQIRAAIVGPARVFGSDVDPALVNRLLNEIGPDADQLPLLQHALMRMWSRDTSGTFRTPVSAPGVLSRSGALTIADYEAVGELSEALSTHADTVLAHLDESQQYIARVMFRRLTERGIGKRDTRRPARLDDIAAVAAVPPQEVIAVVEELRQQDRSFLTPPPPVPLTSDTVLDICHESLIRQWHTLAAWVEEEAESAAQFRRLAETAAWHTKGEVGLMTDPLLSITLAWREKWKPTAAWARRYHDGFDRAIAFLDESREARDAAVRAEEVKQGRKRRNHRLAIVGAVILVVCSGFALEKKMDGDRENAFVDSVAKAENAKKRAEIEKDLRDSSVAAAKARALLAVADSQRTRAQLANGKLMSADGARQALQQMETDPNSAISLALEALRVASVPAAEGALQQTLLRDKRIGRLFQSARLSRRFAARLTPDGTFAVGWDTIGTNSSVRIQNIETGEQLPAVETHGLSSRIQLSPDGRYIVVPESDRSMRVVETATGKAIGGPLNAEGVVSRTFFSPKGNLLGATVYASSVNAVSAQTLVVWETREWRQLPRITDTLTIARILPGFILDEKYILGTTRSGRVRVWETATGRGVRQIGPDTVQWVNAWLSADGKYVGTTDRKGVASLWNTMTGARVAVVGDSSHQVYGLQFSPDEAYMAVTGRFRVPSIWRTASGTRIPNAGDTTHAIDLLVFSPDGRRVLTTRAPVSALGGGRDDIDPVIRVWPAASMSGSPVELRGHSGTVRSARFSQDSRWIVSTADDGTAKLWDAVNGRMVASFTGGSISGASLSVNNRRVLTTSRDSTVRVWATMDLGQTIPLSDPAANTGSVRLASDGEFPASISRNGRYLLARDRGGIARIWNVETGQLHASLGADSAPARSAVMSPEGTHAMTMGDARVLIWDVETGAVVDSLSSSQGFTMADFGGDAHPWVVTELDTVRVWSLKGKEAFHHYAPEASGGCLTVSPDGLWIVTCAERADSGNPTYLVHVRQTHSGTMERDLRGHTGDINDVFFSRDGKFAASVSSDMTARIWEVGTWRNVATLTGHAAAVRYAYFSPDTKTVVTVADDYSLRVWDRSTGTSGPELRGHTGPVKTTAFSSNGRWLVTGSDDHTVFVWDTRTGAAVAEYFGHVGPVIAVAFGRDSQTVISASADGTIRRYKCTLCVPTPTLESIARERKKAVGSLGISYPANRRR